jgi:hypothetical protein
MQQIPSKCELGQAARPAEAIRPLAVPQAAPPYDDEPDEVPAGIGDEGNGGWLAGAAWQPCGPDVDEREPGHPVAPQSGQYSVHRSDPDNRQADAAWPGRFAQVLAETLAGSRPQRQLAPWTTEQARQQISQLGPLFATGERPLVRRVMTTAPAIGVLELTAVVGCGSRVRALALRLERQRSGRGWCCTVIESA